MSYLTEFLNTFLLVVTALISMAGSYIFLLAGLHPLAAFLSLVLWLALTWWAFRLVAASKPTYWHLTIPSLLFLLNLAFFAGTFELLRQQHLRKNGPPRRYYSWDTAPQLNCPHSNQLPPQPVIFAVVTKKIRGWAPGPAPYPTTGINR